MPNFSDNRQGTSIEKMKGKIKINSADLMQQIPDDIDIDLTSKNGIQGMEFGMRKTTASHRLDDVRYITENKIDIGVLQ